MTFTENRVFRRDTWLISRYNLTFRTSDCYVAEKIWPRRTYRSRANRASRGIFKGRNTSALYVAERERETRISGLKNESRRRRTDRSTGSVRNVINGERREGNRRGRAKINSREAAPYRRNAVDRRTDRAATHASRKKRERERESKISSKTTHAHGGILKMNIEMTRMDYEKGAVSCTLSYFVPR